MGGHVEKRIGWGVRLGAAVGMEAIIHGACLNRLGESSQSVSQVRWQRLEAGPSVPGPLSVQDESATLGVQVIHGQVLQFPGAQAGQDGCLKGKPAVRRAGAQQLAYLIHCHGAPLCLRRRAGNNRTPRSRIPYIVNHPALTHNA
jgi:hypothetical protein